MVELPEEGGPDAVLNGQRQVDRYPPGMRRINHGNRFRAGEQLTALIQQYGVEAVAIHFLVKPTTILDWQNDFVPASRQEDLDEYYNKNFKVPA